MATTRGQGMTVRPAEQPSGTALVSVTVPRRSSVASKHGVPLLVGQPSDRDDHLAARVALLHVADGVGGLFERIDGVDHR